MPSLLFRSSRYRIHQLFANCASCACASALLVKNLGGYRRFVQMYSDVVLGIEISHFEKHLERAKAKRGVKQDGMSFKVFRGFI